MTPDEIREARLRLGLTQFQLAAVMGLRGPQTVSEWERGARTPSETAARLLRAYLDGYKPADWPSQRPKSKLGRHGPLQRL